MAARPLIDLALLALAALVIGWKAVPREAPRAAPSLCVLCLGDPVAPAGADPMPEKLP